jgi:hypothetical protein
LELALLKKTLLVDTHLALAGIVSKIFVMTLLELKYPMTLLENRILSCPSSLHADQDAYL